MTESAPQKLRVVLATPLKHFPTDPNEQLLSLPKAIGRALRELAQRPGEAFRAEADKYDFEWMAAVGGLCHARIDLVHEALEGGADWIGWIDADLDVKDGPGTLADAILRILSHRQPIVGGLYCVRGAGPLKAKEKPRWAASFMPAAEMQKNPLAEGLLQLNELGGGFKFIYKKVYTEIAAKVPGIVYRERGTGKRKFGFYQNLVQDGDLISEDYFLDSIARAMQIPILCDTKIQLHHVDDRDGSVFPAGRFPPIPVAE